MFYCPDCNFACDISRGQKRREATGGSRRDSVEETAAEVENAVNTSEDEEEPKRRRRKQPAVVSDSESESESESEDDGEEKKEDEDIVRRRISADYAEIVRMIMQDEAYDEVELTDYNERDLLKHPDFQKLSSKNREMVLGAVQHMLPEESKKVKSSASSTAGKLYYACNNCGYQTPLVAGTLVYKQNVVAATETVSDYDKYRSMTDDPTLPRTRNYTCPNKKCPSLKDPNLCESVAIRPSNRSYRLINICCACKHAWA
jgi:hypothetical protein